MYSLRLNLGGAFAALVLIMIFAMGMAMMLSGCSTSWKKDAAVVSPMDQCTAEEEAACERERLHNGNCLCPREPVVNGSRMGSLNDNDGFFDEPAISPHSGLAE